MGKSGDKSADGQLWQRIAVEGIATYVVILVHIVAAGLFGSDDVKSAICVAAVQGLVIYHAASYFYKSGAHLNFLITCLAAWFKTSPRVKGGAIAGYLVAQLAFSVLAGLTAQFILGLLGVDLAAGVPFLNTDDGVTLGGGFFIEFLLSFVSLLTYLIAAREFGTTQQQNNPALAAGLTHFVLVSIGFVFTGASINPLRHFAGAILIPTVAYDVNSWIYYVAPVVAMLVAVLVFALFFKSAKKC